jgi:hypothetical protein
VACLGGILLLLFFSLESSAGTSPVPGVLITAEIEGESPGIGALSINPLGWFYLYFPKEYGTLKSNPPDMARIRQIDPGWTTSPSFSQQYGLNVILRHGFLRFSDSEEYRLNGARLAYLVFRMNPNGKIKSVRVGLQVRYTWNDRLHYFNMANLNSYRQTFFETDLRNIGLDRTQALYFPSIPFRTECGNAIAWANLPRFERERLLSLHTGTGSPSEVLDGLKGNWSGDARLINTLRRPPKLEGYQPSEPSQLKFPPDRETSRSLFDASRLR